MTMRDDRHEAMVEVSRRIGGSTQRSRAMDETIIEDLPCELADELELLFGWGIIQAILVQRLCQAVANDDQRIGNRNHPRIKKLSAAGSYGYYGGNIRRDLFRYWGRSMNGMFQPAMIDIPYRKFRGHATNVVHRMMLPI